MNDPGIIFIEQIGKGSFSNVYLCKRSIKTSSVLFWMDNTEELFIIKEINLNKLVKKYISANVTDRSERYGKPLLKTIADNITPYRDTTYMNTSLINDEREYYYKKLKDLIRSEVEALLLLNHKNIIKYYNCNENNGIYCLNMEYCNGGDVHNLLKTQMIDRNKRGGLSISIIRNFLLDIGGGIEYMHSQNIIHRDIKLQNILMHKVDNIMIFKLTDFGFACYDINNTSLESKNSLLYKKYYKICGTPYYMAPEIILNLHLLENFTKYKYITEESNGKNNFYNKSIDMWSLGICLFELVLASFPYFEITSINSLERFFRGKTCQLYIWGRIEENKDELGESLVKILNKLLTMNNIERLNINDLMDIIVVSKFEINYNENANYNGNYNGNRLLGEHVISNPLSPCKSLYESVSLSDSWEKIEDSALVSFNPSIEVGFLNWLMKGNVNK